MTPTTSIIHIQPHPPMSNPPASVRPPSVQVALFLVDDLCVLSGLGARPELNGCGGRVIAGGAGGIGPDAASGRYGVRIHVETKAHGRFGESGRYGAQQAPNRCLGWYLGAANLTDWQSGPRCPAMAGCAFVTGAYRAASRASRHADPRAAGKPEACAAKPRGTNHGHHVGTKIAVFLVREPSPEIALFCEVSYYIEKLSLWCLVFCIFEKQKGF